MVDNITIFKKKLFHVFSTSIFRAFYHKHTRLCLKTQNCHSCESRNPDNTWNIADSGFPIKLGMTLRDIFQTQPKQNEF